MSGVLGVSSKGFVRIPVSNTVRKSTILLQQSLIGGSPKGTFQHRDRPKGTNPCDRRFCSCHDLLGLRGPVQIPFRSNFGDLERHFMHSVQEM